MKKCCKCHKMKRLEEFNINRGRKDRRQTMCRECERIRRQEYYRANTEKFLGYNRKRKKILQEWFSEFKKTLRCECCSDDRWYVLQFHHLDPTSKEEAVSNVFKNSRSIEKVQKEIEKCQVVCANCHAEIHFLERKN